MRSLVSVCGAFASACLLAVGLQPGSAAAAEAQHPQWTVTSVSRPTNFKPGDASGDDSYEVTVANTGGAASDGSTIQITDELPEGLTIDPAGARGEDHLANARLSCVNRTCTYAGVVGPDQTLNIVFPVDVAPGPYANSCEVADAAVGCLTNVVHVSGGGALDASMSTPTTISEAPAGFGIAPGGSVTALSTTQAGAHPDITTSIAFDTVDPNGALAAPVKDTTDELPPGFAGDLVEAPTCSVALFVREECPTDTQIGITTLTLTELGDPSQTVAEAVYNLAPNPGAVAKLGFSAQHIFGVQGDITVRPSDYGLTATFENIEEAQAELDAVSLTIWGVPEDPVHDPLRYSGGVSGHFGVSAEGAARVPFFTNPTACSGTPLQARFLVTSWEEGAGIGSAQMPIGPLIGCDRLSMEPSMSVQATTDKAEAASGLALQMNIPQTYDNPEGLATSNLKKAVVALPEGMTVNPSASAGLAGCTPEELAQEGSRYVEGQGCPHESKLGSVRIKTPALAEELTGSVYLAQPYDNLAEFGNAAHPLGSLLALYVVARLPSRGIIIKVAGHVEPDLQTGRLVTTFDNLPPLPFSTFDFDFIQGPTSPLVTPALCGQYSAQAGLTPWSNPEGSPLEPSIAPFPITAGVGGGACPSGGVPAFKPTVVAGTEDNAAGSYSPLYLRIERQDGEQEITGFGTQLPPGLTGDLSGIEKCSEADVQHAREQTGAEAEADPACPAGSEIGHTIAEAGVGIVLAQTPGKLYLGGPLEGAPLSVVSVTSTKVGPFDLGTVVVHLPLDINPITAAVSIPSGAADQIPHIINGIVIHLRAIRVYISRHDFMIDPTSCEPMSIGATVVGAGANFADPADANPVTVTDRFQAADCSSLAFKPFFKASTSGKTSRANGASLHVKLTYPKAPFGTQSNIKSVHVELPKALPSRLSTLNHACLDSVFNQDPASCPSQSKVGFAKAVTPVLPVPLEGPAYFVSHGGQKFPELIVVLQGYGVTVYLEGETFISKAGITSSTFKAVPDVPVGSFELNLPEGPFSTLAANRDLCAAKLVMPAVFTGQNGTVLKQSAKLAVTGCKPAIRVVGHSVKGSHASIRVTVPSAGTLVAAGGSIKRSVKRVAKAGTVRIDVTLTSQRLRVLAKNPHQRVNAKVKLRFRSKHGAPLTAYVRLLMG